MSEAFDLHWDREWELYEEAKFEEAIVEWREASRLGPEDGYVSHSIGLALSSLGREEEAVVEWREAVRLEPDYDKPHRSLAYALSETGSSKALAAVRAAIRLCPDSADLHVWLGYHLIVETQIGGKYGDKADYEAAAAAFQRAISLNYSNFYAFHYLAMIQEQHGRRQEAVETLKAAVALAPNSAEAHFALWECQNRAFWRGRNRIASLRGAMQTANAINKLPDSEPLARYYERLNRFSRRFLITVFIVSSTAIVLILRRQKRT